MFNGKYSQGNTGSETHFSQGIMGETEFSRMESVSTHVTTFNAGDIIPIYYAEVLPHDTFSIDIDAVIRQNTLLTPTMGNMIADFYAFFVPNRVVNKSSAYVFGENPNSSWTATPVSFAPLLRASYEFPQIQIPVGSVADYYGFPTQQPFPTDVLKTCNDLKFRGYVEIYNEFFRDQNYQPPVPYSKLNVYEGFFEQSSGDYVGLDGSTSAMNILVAQPDDGTYGAGSIAQEVFGNIPRSGLLSVPTFRSSSSFNALALPLKANKLHDYFTSVLPSPQKGPQVFVPIEGAIEGVAPVFPSASNIAASSLYPGLRWHATGSNSFPGATELFDLKTRSDGASGPSVNTFAVQTTQSTNPSVGVYPANLFVDLQNANVSGLSLSVSDLRLSAAVQQVYEALGRGGSRYREYVRSFFGIEVDDPFKDIPTFLGHIRRELNLYQTAQTSASESGNTPQGNLAAFGYTQASGQLFAPFTALENGYIHVFVVVRHKNIYPSYLSPDNFRLNMFDFYQPQLANISEQPVYTKFINPFVSDSTQVFGYQEAWAEYRYDPDRVSGYMRPGVSGSLALWNYADDFSSSLTIADSEFIKSNSQAVLDRTLAVTSSVAPQLKGQFVFKVDKQRPMPTYSVPGLDIV